MCVVWKSLAVQEEGPAHVIGAYLGWEEPGLALDPGTIVTIPPIQLFSVWGNGADIDARLLRVSGDNEPPFRARLARTRLPP